MEFRSKIHQSVLQVNKLESAKDMQLLNERLTQELQDTLQIISKRKNYLDQYWYNLKYFVKSLHAAYRILYKLLFVYGDRNVCKKLKFHDLIYGPRPIAQNLAIFSELINFLSLQLAYIHCIVKFKLHVPMQDKVTFLLHQLVKYFDRVIWLDDVTGKYIKNGLPIKMEFI